MDIPFPTAIWAGALVIFCLRVCDVTLGTIRTIMMVKGRYPVAGLIGFFEVLIFVVAISQVLLHLETIWHAVGYAGGYATGTILGGFLEGRMALGYVEVSAHCRDGWRMLAGELRAEGFGVTEYAAQGKDGVIHVVETLVPRRDLPLALDVIRATAPDAFVHANEQQFIYRGYFRRPKQK
jgi:uncharacterized protein YebE (UPF0316 family)